MSVLLLPAWLDQAEAAGGKWDALVSAAKPQSRDGGLAMGALQLFPLQVVTLLLMAEAVLLVCYGREAVLELTRMARTWLTMPRSSAGH